MHHRITDFIIGCKAPIALYGGSWVSWIIGAQTHDLLQTLFLLFSVVSAGLSVLLFALKIKHFDKRDTD